LDFEDGPIDRTDSTPGLGDARGGEPLSIVSLFCR
jgi:hypothetical protein